MHACVQTRYIRSAMSIGLFNWDDFTTMSPCIPLSRYQRVFWDFLFQFIQKLHS
jgi:hypothetical protein